MNDMLSDKQIMDLASRKKYSYTLMLANLLDTKSYEDTQGEIKKLLDDMKDDYALILEELRIAHPVVVYKSLESWLKLIAQTQSQAHDIVFLLNEETE